LLHAFIGVALANISSITDHLCRVGTTLTQSACFTDAIHSSLSATGYKLKAPR